MTPQARRLLIWSILGLVALCVVAHAVTYSAASVRHVSTSGAPNGQIRVYERDFRDDTEVRRYRVAGYVEWLLIKAHAKLFERTAPHVDCVVLLQGPSAFICFPRGAIYPGPA
jgi:hypothetical protein